MRWGGSRSAREWGQEVESVEARDDDTWAISIVKRTGD